MGQKEMAKLGMEVRRKGQRRRGRRIYSLYMRSRFTKTERRRIKKSKNRQKRLVKKGRRLI